MPYPYGMQNSPVVGNGLGGLPRRATAALTTATTGARRYTLQTIATSTSSIGTVYQPATMSPVIMNNGIITRFYQSSVDSNIRTWTCSYSESGLGTASDTSLATTTWDNTMLPSGQPKYMNFCWKKNISSTLNLYYYTGNIRPFWVDTSFATPVYYVPTATSTGTYINGDGTYTSMTLSNQTAIIGKNGNLLMLGVTADTGRIAILEFNSADTSQVRVAWTGLTGGNNGAFTLGRIRTQSFGYSILIVHTTASANYEVNMKLSSMTDNLGRLGTRTFSTYEPNATASARGITCALGDTSAYALLVSGSTATSMYQKRAIMNISSTGALTGNTGGDTMLNQQFNATQLLFNCPNFPAGPTLQSATYGITTNIDGTGHNAFIDYGVNYSSQSLFTAESQSLGLYTDIDVVPPQWTTNNTARPCNVNTLAFETISYGSSNIYAAGVAQDNDGFVFVDNTYGQSGNILYKKVYL